MSVLSDMSEQRSWRRGWRLAGGLVAGWLAIAPLAAGQQATPSDPGPTGQDTDVFYDWAWGELTYGQSYKTVLTITNKCRVPRPVHIFISDPFYPFTVNYGNRREKVLRWKKPPLVDGRFQQNVPPGAKQPYSARAMLSIPAAGCAPSSRLSQQPTVCSTVAPPGVTTLDVMIQAPAPPDLTGLIPPPGFDITDLYEEVAGEVVVYTPPARPACLPSREEYTPSGHIHLDPNPPPPGGGPRCRDWWDREAQPQGLEAEQCVDEIRRLATAYRQGVIVPLLTAAPDAWAWVPAEEALQTMTVEALIAMKTRARLQRHGGVSEGAR